MILSVFFIDSFIRFIHFPLYILILSGENYYLLLVIIHFVLCIFDFYLKMMFLLGVLVDLKIWLFLFSCDDGELMLWVLKSFCQLNAFFIDWRIYFLDLLLIFIIDFFVWYLEMLDLLFLLIDLQERCV